MKWIFPGSHCWRWLRYFPATMPHTWPSSFSALLQKPVRNIYKGVQARSGNKRSLWCLTHVKLQAITLSSASKPTWRSGWIITYQRAKETDRATQRERDLIFPDPSVSCRMFCALLTADLIVLDGVALGWEPSNPWQIESISRTSVLLMRLMKKEKSVRRLLSKTNCSHLSVSWSEFRARLWHFICS